ncbi:hypothetical protein AAG570_001761 [Ranatra chinensis]|uniref:Uncharacterized protein n=1 Tax=Ranatra chinensis TaxID=642074 RepID=A0ABD0Y9F5_9HEMI
MWPVGYFGAVCGTAVVLFLVTLLVLLTYVLYLYLVRVKLGRPPLDRLSIAYKYAYMGKSTYDGVFSRFQCLFPACKGIKVCYSGPKASYIEYAYGIAFNDGTMAAPTVRMKQELNKNTFSTFTMPEITYAMFLILPVVSWLKFTHWLAVAIGYIKIYNFSQKYNLCGYPVFEVYEKDRIFIIVPLMRQDDFVVWQAERIVYGRNYSAMLRPMTLFNCEQATAAKPSPPPPAPPPVVGNSPKLARKLKGKKKKG